MSLFVASGIARVSISGAMAYNATADAAEAPQWTGTPSPSFTAGQSGNYSVASFVDNETSTSLYSGTLPSGITFSSSSFVADGTQSAGTYGPFVIQATNAAGSANSSPFSFSVSAAPSTVSNSLWEVIDMSSVIVQYPSGLTSTYTGAPGYRIPGGKDLRGAYRPSDGLLYFGGGDWPTDATGLAIDAGSGSGSNGIWSVNPSTNTASSFLFVNHRSSTDQGQVITMGLDQTGMLHDPVTDTILTAPGTAFQPYWFLRTDGTVDVPASTQTNPHSEHPLVVPKYISSTSFYLDGKWTNTLIVGQMFYLYLTHSIGGTFPPNYDSASVIRSLDDLAYLPYLQGRIVTISYSAGTNRTTITFQARPDVPWPNFTQDGKGLHVCYLTATSTMDTVRRTGAWLDTGEIGYNEATGKFVCGLIRFNPSTRTFSRQNFEMGAQYAVTSAGALTTDWQLTRSRIQPLLTFGSTAAYVPAAVTGRNAEVIYPKTNDVVGAYVWDMSALTFNIYRNGTGTDSIENNFSASMGNGGCNSGLDSVRRRIWGVNPYFSRLLYFDIQLRVLRSAGVFSEMIAEGTSGTHGAVYNSDIDMVEVYAQKYGEDPPKVLLFDPSTTPITVHSLANGQYTPAGYPAPLSVTYVDGELVDGMNWVRAGSRTWGTRPTQDRTKQINFIGNNLRWTEVTASPHWHNAAIAGNGTTKSHPYATDEQDNYETTLIAPAPFGGGAWEIDASGYPTGVYLQRGGGDSDYAGNEVTVCRFDQLAGTVFPCTTNLGTDKTTQNLWRNRSHASYKKAGTGCPELFVNPSDYSEWQPATAHLYGRSICIPGYGYVEHCQIPPGGGTPTPQTNTGPYTPTYSPEYGTMYWGHNTNGRGSYAMSDPATDYPSTGVGIAYWRYQGTNAGKWQTLAVAPIYPYGITNIIESWADWNTSTSKLIGYNIAGANTAQIFEWTLAGGWAYVRGIGAFDGVGFCGQGSYQSAFYWLTGNTYFVTRGTSPIAVIEYDHSTGSAVTKTASGHLATEFAAGRHPTCWVDREHGKVWWMFGHPSSLTSLTVYYSTISDYLNLKKINYAGSSTFTGRIEIGANGPRRICRYGGYLWMTGIITGSQFPGTDDAAQRIYRLPVF